MTDAADPIQAAVEDVLGMLIRMAETYYNAAAHGIFPAGDSIRWPFQTSDDYGDYDAEAVRDGAVLALRTRVYRPRPSAREIDEADRVYRAAIHALTKQQLFEIFIEGSDRSDRAKAKLAGLSAYRHLRSRQEASARALLAFLIFSENGVAKVTNPESVIDSVANSASNDDVRSFAEIGAGLSPSPQPAQSLTKSQNETPAPPMPTSIDLDSLAAAKARLLGRSAPGETA